MAVQELPVGDHVECDQCGKDYTSDPASGGFLLTSKGVGPCCAARVEALCRQYGEEGYITARCPADLSFADWVRRDLRGDRPGVITVLTGQDADDWLRGRG